MTVIIKSSSAIENEASSLGHNVLPLTILISVVHMGESDAKWCTDVSPQGLLNMQTFSKRWRTFRKVRKGYMLDKVVEAVSYAQRFRVCLNCNCNSGGV